MNDDSFWIPVFQDQVDAVMALWSLYVIVVALIVGFTAQAKSPMALATRWLLVGAFAVFAVTNALPMYQTLVELQAIHGALSDEARTVFRSFSITTVMSVHVMFDVVVALFVLLVGRKQTEQ